MNQSINWTVSAIKSSKVNNEVDLNKLKNNFTVLFNNSKQMYLQKDQGQQKYDTFILNATSILILCAESVQENVILPEDNELHYIYSKLIPIKDKDVLSVIKMLNCTHYLSGILTWLPLKPLCLFIQEIAQSEPLADNYALMRQFTYGLVFMSQYAKDYSFLTQELRRSLVSFYSENMPTKNTEDRILAEYLYTLLGFFNNFIDLYNQELIQFTFNKGIIKELFVQSEKVKLSDDDMTSLKLFIKTILWNFNIKGEYFKDISIESWSQYDTDNEYLPISLSKIDLSASEYKTAVSKEADRLLTKFKKNLLPEHEMHEYEYLLDFLEKTAEMSRFNIHSLPVYGTTQFDLKTVEKVLVDKQVFSNRNCYYILNNFKQNVDPKCVEIFLENSIDYYDSGRIESNVIVTDFDWKELVLRYSRILSEDALIKVLKTKLLCGKKDVLFVDSFSEKAISVFNQLSSLGNQIYGSIIWLCLMSGEKVVTDLVSYAVKKSGFTVVVATAISKIDFICFSKKVGDEKLLMNFVLENINIGDNAQLTNFMDLIFCILKTVKYENLQVFFEELLHFLILPSLKCEETGIPIRGIFALEMLNSIRRRKHGLGLPMDTLSKIKTIVALLHIHHNYCTICPKGFETSLKKIEDIIKYITSHIDKSEGMQTKGMAYALKIISSRQFHPRTCAITNKFIPLDYSQTFTTDKILVALISDDYTLLRKELQIGTKKEDFNDWKVSLALVLPYCLDFEWTRAMNLTCEFDAINTNDFITQIKSTISIFKGIVVLYALKFKEANFLSSLFNKFASSIDAFFKNKVSNLPIKKKINIILDFMIWWNHQIHAFPCSEDGLIVLNKFISMLGVLVQEKDFDAKKEPIHNLFNFQYFIVSFGDRTMIPSSKTKTALANRLVDIVGR